MDQPLIVAYNYYDSLRPRICTTTT